MTRSIAPDELHALRQILLPEVMDMCGARPDPQDRKRWLTVQGKVSVNGLQFMNWNRGRGGGGAIDLVMHLQELDFLAAVAWLRQRFSQSTPVSPPEPCSASAVAGSARPLLLPSPNTRRWSAVEHYLEWQRAVPRKLIAALVQSGLLYADAHANAVFLLRGENQHPVGAELRGTGPVRWRGLAPGSRRELGYFAVRPLSPNSIVLCESAIDALSCHVLHPDCYAISTSGARADPRWLPMLLQQGLPTYCGFDADPVGDQQAQLMMRLHSQVLRLRPPRHDWNDVLKQNSSNPPSSQP